jgi:hypothetical protein
MGNTQTTALVDSFKNTLLHFGLSAIEINVLTAVMIHGKSSLSDLRKDNKCRFYSTGKITQIIHRLVKCGWLQIIQSKPMVVTIVSKKNFQEVLDKIINKTQDLFMAQKNGAYDLLNTIKTYEQQTGEGVTEDQGFKINPKTPDFIKNWIVELLKVSNWRIAKSEGYMAVSLTKEGIAFKLSSAEFETKSGDSPSYAGIFMCEFEDSDMRNSLLPRIHQYNEDALKFNYKMERKGYIEGRNRHLIESEMSPAQKETDGFKSEFKLKFEGEKNVLGSIFTFPLAGNAIWVVSIWAESTNDLKILQKEIKSLK